MTILLYAIDLSEMYYVKYNRVMLAISHEYFFNFFVWLMVFVIVNFAMVLFALFAIEKMSRAIWSKKHLEDEQSKKTSQMDR